MATTNDAMFTALSGSYPSAGQTLGDLLYAFWSEKGLQYRGTLERDWYIQEGALLKTNRTNLVINPSLETNETGWIVSGTGSTGVRSTLQYLFGTASIKWDYPSTLAQPVLVYNPGVGSFRIPVVEGQTYTASVYLFTDNVDDYRVDIRWATAVTGGTVTDTGGTSALITANTWTRYSATGTCPVGYSFAQVNIYRLTNTVTGTTYADGALFETGSSLLPYFDGTYADAYMDYTLTSQSWGGTVNGSSSNGEWIKNGQTLGDLAYNYFTNIYDLVTFDYSEPDEWLELQVFDRYDTVEQQIFIS
jgi:hypothetical protein